MTPNPELPRRARAAAAPAAPDAPDAPAVPVVPAAAWSRRRVLRAGRRLAAGGLGVLGAGGLGLLGGCCGMLEDEEAAGPDDDPAADGPFAGEPAPAGPVLPPPPSQEPRVRVRIGSHPPGEAVRVGEPGERLAIDGGAASPGATMLPGTEGGGNGTRGPGLPAPVELRVDRRGWSWVDAEGRTGRVAGETIEVGRPVVARDARDADRDRRVGAGTAGGRGGRGDRPADRDDLEDPAGNAGHAGPAGPVVRPDPAGEVAWSGARWPGRLRLIPGRRRVDVVAVVPMEAYLPGVLARELIPGWRAATFEAQAIAARSFATFELLDRPGRPWDVESDERSQVFRGVTELAAAGAAARATAGVVLTYAGGVLPGYYSSTCGGLGMPATAAIGPRRANAVPPLAGHAIGDCCAGAPRFRWTAVRTLERVREQLDRWGRTGGPAGLAGLGPIRDLQVATRTPAGRPLAHRIVPVAGPPVRMSAPQLRRALTEGRRRTEDPVWSSFLEPVVDRDGGVVRFAGRGFGHGAGLCQYGAEALAAAGRTATEILAAYYPDAELTRTWTASTTT